MVAMRPLMETNTLSQLHVDPNGSCGQSAGSCWVREVCIIRHDLEQTLLTMMCSNWDACAHRRQSQPQCTRFSATNKEELDGARLQYRYIQVFCCFLAGQQKHVLKSRPTGEALGHSSLPSQITRHNDQTQTTQRHFRFIIVTAPTSRPSSPTSTHHAGRVEFRVQASPIRARR